MSNNKNFETEYFNIVSSFGKEAFGEILGDNTQKRQSALILSSIVTILVSLALITPVDGSAGGVNFLFTRPELLPVISGVICLYYLMIYAVNVERDLRFAEYKRLPVDIDMALLETSLEIESLKTQKRIGELQVELSELLDVKVGIDEVYKNRRKDISSEITKITEYIPKVYERSKYLYQSHRKISFSKKAFLWAEIGFPVVLSISAIALVVWVQF